MDRRESIGSRRERTNKNIIPQQQHENENQNNTNNNNNNNIAPPTNDATSTSSLLLNNTNRTSTIVDDNTTNTNTNIAAMFDLAAPPVEAPLFATLIPDLNQIDENLKQLLNVSNVRKVPRIEIRKENNSNNSNSNSSSFEIVLGRSVDLKFPYRIDFPRLSSEHCRFRVVFDSSVDENNNNNTENNNNASIFIIDTSTNGVWLNGQRLHKNQPQLLKGGETISLLKPNTNSTENLAVHFPFVFELQQQQENENKNKTSLQSPTKATMNEEDVDQFQAEITCSICLGTYIKPTCAVPCLHTFCQPCIRQHVAEALGNGTSSNNIKCPECRVTMTSTQLNHKVQALILQVEKIRPEVERSEEDIKIMEEAAKDSEEKAKKNRPSITSFDIGKNKKKNKKNRFHGGEDDEYWDEDEEEEFSDEDEDEEWNGAGAGAGVNRHWNFGGGIAGAGVAAFNPMNFAFGNQPRLQCQNCHQPDPRDGFQCPQDQQHIRCKECGKVFPDRPAQQIPQRCKFCAGAFCDLYCGPCRSQSGVGILKPLQDHDELDRLPPPNLIFKGNAVEFQIFQQYLQDNHLDIKDDVWKVCLEKFKSGEWTLDATATGMGMIDATTPMCRPCVFRVFALLLVHYRINIPRDNWPPAIAARPDCWHGLECRTQHHNPQHAQKYNHVCFARKRKE